MSNLKEEYAIENKFEEFQELGEFDKFNFLQDLLKKEDGEKIVGRIFYSLSMVDKSYMLRKIVDRLFYTRGKEGTELEELASVFKQNIDESELVKLYQVLSDIDIIIDGSEL